MARKLICQWRVSPALPSGLQVWFDPKTETIRLYELEPEQLRGVADALESDDTASLFDELDQVNGSSPGGEDDLPF